MFLQSVVWFDQARCVANPDLLLSIHRGRKEKVNLRLAIRKCFLLVFVVLSLTVYAVLTLCFSGFTFSTLMEGGHACGGSTNEDTEILLADGSVGVQDAAIMTCTESSGGSTNE